MRKLITFLSLMLSGVVAAQSNRITVTSANLTDAAGNPISNATLTWTPTACTAFGVGIGFRSSGGGQSVGSPVSVAVNGGSFLISLPNVAKTDPVNVGFSLSLTDNTSGNTIPLGSGYGCVQPSSALYAQNWCSTTNGTTVCNFDRFGPNTAPVAALTLGDQGNAGPVGPQGVPGNAGNLATPQSAGVLYTPPGAIGSTLFPVALSGIASQLVGPVSSGGVHRGGQAMTGYIEQFTPDARCYPGSTNVIGYDYSAANTCNFPGNFRPATAGTTAEFFRNLAFGAGAVPPAPSHWAVTMTDVFDGSSNGAEVGMSHCAVSSWDCGASNEVYAFVRSSGFGMQSGSYASVMWFTTGNPTGVSGQSDSGPFGGCCSTSGFQGWAPPPTGAEYDVTMFNPGDGTALLSVMPQGGKVCCGASFRIPFPFPPLFPHQFLTRVFSANDYVSNVGMAAGYTQQAGLPVYDLPEAATVQTAAMLRWSLHANGTEGNYQSGCTDCSNVWEWIPANGKGPRPWVVHVHGNENSIVSLYSDYDSNGANVASTLFQNGFVIVSLDFHSTVQGCPACVYGDAQNVADIAMAIAKVRAASPVPLAPMPYAMADSAGGVTLFNAISHGAILPKAVIGYSLNLNLLSDAQGNDYHDQQGGSNQMGLIQSAYGFASPALYSTATAGYDPLAIVQSPSTSLSPLLLPNAAQRFASIPMLLVADQAGGSGGDQVVDPALNSTPFCAAINLINPGDCTISYIGGGHISPNKFVGATARDYFNANQ